MKAKISFLLILFSVVNICQAGVVRHTLISVSEQKVMNKMFKHVIKSGNKQQDEFFIDGISVGRDQYSRDLEYAEKKEREEQRAKDEEKRRLQLKFSDTMQATILAKLTKKDIEAIQTAFSKLEHPHLEYFFVFDDSSIVSPDQFDQLKKYVIHSQDLITQLVDANDINALQDLHGKLEVWPDRLEIFFQESIQNAIQKSDDTALLKELLTLVSEH